MRNMGTEIVSLPKETWKRIVKTKVRQYVFVKLVNEAKCQKHPLDTSSYLALDKQSYITELSPARTRKIFHMRTNTIDLRTIRKYQHGDNSVCRLCNADKETITHVVNICPEIPRKTVIPDIYTTNCDLLQSIADRLAKFHDLINDKECEC